MPNLGELGVKVGPSFIEKNHLWSTLIQDNGFGRLKTSTSYWSCKRTFKTREGDTNLETKLLKIQHMSRPQIFTLAHQCLFQNRHFQCTWPPREHVDQSQTSQHTPTSSKSKPLGSHVVGSKYSLSQHINSLRMIGWTILGGGVHQKSSAKKVIRLSTILNLGGLTS